LNSIHRQKVEERATVIIAEEMTLCDLRKARQLAQARVAKVFGITEEVSRGLKNVAIYREYQQRSGNTSLGIHFGRRLEGLLGTLES
jgi:acyl-CoA synthetase (NDP forming)